jgi:hypothetical protein
MPEKNIKIKFNQLNYEVKKNVEELVKSRKSRAESTIQGIEAGLALGAITETSINAMLQQIGEKPVIHVIALIPLGSIVGAFSQYKKGSKEVGHSTKSLGKFISKSKFLDEKELFDVAKYRETHPFAFVKRNGDLILVPKTRFQKTLVKAQNTFLEELIPARERIKY